MLVTQYNKYITALRKYLGLTSPELNPDIQEALIVSPIVNLTVDLARLTTKTWAATGALNLSASANFIAAVAVGAGQKWHVTNLYRGSTTGSTLGLGLHLSAAGVDVDLGKAGTAQGELVVDFWLDPGDQVGIYGTNNGADTAIIFSVLYEIYTYTEVG